MKRIFISGKVFESEVTEDDVYKGSVVFADVLQPHKSETLNDILLEKFANKKVNITIEEVFDSDEHK